MVNAERERDIYEERVEDPVGRAWLEYESGYVDLSDYQPGVRLAIIDSLNRSAFELYVLRPLIVKIHQVWSGVKTSLSSVVE